MRFLRDRRFRWPLMLLLVVVLNVALVAYNGSRTCAPTSCDGTWITAVVLGSLAAVVLVEIGALVRTAIGRRACPRCGRGVTKGHLDCAHCGYDFRTIRA